MYRVGLGEFLAEFDAKKDGFRPIYVGFSDFFGVCESLRDNARRCEARTVQMNDWWRVLAHRDGVLVWFLGSVRLFLEKNRSKSNKQRVFPAG